jgi:hypothetical protein
MHNTYSMQSNMQLRNFFKKCICEFNRFCKRCIPPNININHQLENGWIISIIILRWKGGFGHQVKWTTLFNAKSHSLNEVAYNPWSFNIELFPNFPILESSFFFEWYELKTWLVQWITYDHLTLGFSCIWPWLTENNFVRNMVDYLLIIAFGIDI